MLLISLSKKELIRQIRANPADPEVFQIFYCADCQQYITAGGLFVTLEKQLEHSGHAVAWLPGQDSFANSGGSNGHVANWLQLYQPRLETLRYEQLAFYASTVINSDNWVWFLQGAEQRDWLTYLDDYLNRLADAWLASLNGQPSHFFPASHNVWPLMGGQGRWYFDWKSVDADPVEELLKLINPGVV